MAYSPNSPWRAVLVSTGLAVVTCMTMSVFLFAGNGDESTSDGATDAKAAMDRMNNEKLGTLLRHHFREFRVEGDLGRWIVRLKKDQDQDEQDGPRPANNGADRLDAPEKDEGSDQPAAGDRDAESPGETEKQEVAVEPMLIVLTDERANRMRIMMPIQTMDLEKVEDLQLALIALHANYDRALDARYAVQNGMLWSVFLHPLGSLAESDLESALEQVQALRKNTGTTFSSTDLMFAPARPVEVPKKPKEDPPVNDLTT